MKLASGYDRTKAPVKTEYRPMTVAEAKALTYGQHVTFLANDGTARDCKVNGAPKTWKRDPSRVEVPIKYGMYEYARFSSQHDGTMERLLVLVSE